MRTRWSPPVVDPGRLAELAAEIERIGELIRHGGGVGPGEAEAAMAAFRARTGHDHTIADFVDYHGSRSLADFALEAARPARPRIADITRAELVEIVERILAGDAELDWYLLVLTVNVAHPRVTELIFGGPAGGAGAPESAEEIVDAASAYRAIAL
ncbi:hypothetical protein OG948_46150 (plasmid) [Embleya sp. NBC_00888]|uniref:hypothetical protein n=1 Tax=Embleya sp. NBC_00888 TaxID=2975960 RepID=UPI002F90CF80|nr:hypothetical protein OG948_46150 [Embleya sp. NBC_00888]